VSERTTHVATVHFAKSEWIDIQLAYLERFLQAPYRTYAFLSDVPGDHSQRFSYATTEAVESHAAKLNLLADEITFAAADPSDVLVFLDGDAFPVAPLAPLIERRLEPHKLIAVQRAENNGDKQPHPCFCVTTVGFWNEIQGDWHPGHYWRDADDTAVTDVGGNLLGILDRHRVDWYPLRRLNAYNPHPLLFGVYGDDEFGAVVYHHGQGFRRGLGGRISVALNDERRLGASVRARALNRLPHTGPLGRVRARWHPQDRLRERMAAEAAALSARVMRQIEHDAHFWTDFAPDGRAAGDRKIGSRAT
jgi:hypothetical protein